MRVLVAEDDPSSSRLLKARLQKWGYEVVVAASGRQAWRILQEDDAPALAVLDWMMPEMDGAEVCRRIRQRGQIPYTYVLLLTAKGRKCDLIQGLEAGADDYLSKPLDFEELRLRLRAGQRIVRLQHDLIQAQEKLRHQASHDSLTGLWNHVAILEILRKELARAQRDNTSVGITMADIDHFKAVNDTYGHRVGDQVLCEVTRRILASMRVYDSVGRYGGEEFLIILPRCDLECGRRQAERLRANVVGEPVAVGQGNVEITVSLGVAASDLAPKAEPEWLLMAADKALYRAKNDGRNCVRLAVEADCLLGDRDHSQA